MLPSSWRKGTPVAKDFNGSGATDAKWPPRCRRRMGREFDFAFCSLENAGPMTQGLSFVPNGNAARAFAVSLLAAVLLAGCKEKQAVSAAPPNFATTVVAAEARRQPIAETLALVGTLVANEFIEVKSETDGTIAEILFAEGQPVTKGDLLIRLDESKLAAALAESEANLKLSATTFERNKQLFRDKLISQQEYDQAAATFQANEATVALRKRLLQDTRI